MKGKCGTGQKAFRSACVRALSVNEATLNPALAKEVAYAANSLLRYPQALAQVAEAAKAVLNHRKETPWN